MLLVFSTVSAPYVSVSSVFVDRLVVYRFCALLVLMGPALSFCDLKLFAMGGGVGMDLLVVVSRSGYVGVRKELAWVANQFVVSICFVVTFIHAFGVS